MPVNDNNDDYVIVEIIEDANTKLKQLLSTAVTSILQKEMIGNQARQIINDCIKQLQDHDADSSLISKTEIGLKGSFMRWYNDITAKLLNEAKKKKNPYYALSYKSITGIVPKANGKSLIISLGLTGMRDSRDIELGDNLEEGAVKNIRDFFTTWETGYSQMFIEDYQKRVNQEIIRLAGLNVVLRDRRGRRMSVRNLAEMQVRYEEQVKDIKKLKNNGVTYVVATSHVNASSRCQPWQGKIFILDAEVGSVEIKDNHYNGEPEPRGKTPDGKDYYSLKEAMSHGFLGYNCRHHLVRYEKGMTMPREYPARRIQNERSKETYIRNMENNIRKEKRKALILPNKEERKKARQNAQALEKEYWQYCKEHDYAVAEWRTRISLEEREGLKSGAISFESNDRNMGNIYERGSLNNKNIVLKQNEDRYVFKFKAKFNWTKHYRKNKKISFSNHFTLIKDENNVIHALDRHPEILEKVPNYINVIKNALDNPENVYVNDNDEKYGKNNLTLLIPLSKKERYMQIGIVMSNAENRIKSFRYTSIKDKKLDEFIKERNFKKIK